MNAYDEGVLEGMSDEQLHLNDEYDPNSPFPYFQSPESRESLEREYEPPNVE
jgi:hypothetical protein